MYAYQTDARGVYPRSDALRGTGAFRHGRLRGWARSDAEGRYAFETIRPSSYPDSDMPAHVHFHVLEPGRCTYYIDDIHFLDDPRLTEAKRRSVDQGRGGSGIAQPTRDSSGRWLVQRDISLGRGVNGYERCG